MNAREIAIGVQELLVEKALGLGLSLTSEQIEKIAFYVETLDRWNKKFNLTGSRNKKEIVTVHVRDSLLPLKVFDLGNKLCVDIGSGAGFPGLVLAVMVPNSEFTLIEANKKKAAFLNFVVAELKLENVQVFADRAESMKQKNYFDYGYSRATANASDIWMYSRRLLKVGGRLIYWKGKGTKRGEMNFVMEHSGKLVQYHAFILSEPRREVRLFVVERIS